MKPRPPGPERVICAAIWVDDGKMHPHQPHNLKTGMVFAGWRHFNCFPALNAVYPKPSWFKKLLHSFGLVDIVPEEQRHGSHQGFLTSTGRFVSREAAAEIAREAGQLDYLKIEGTSPNVWAPSWLTSEELY